MTRGFGWIVCGLAIACCLGGDADAAKSDKADSGFTVAEFLQAPTLHEPALSADGQWLAFVRAQRDFEADRRISQVWLYDVRRQQAHQVSFHENGARSPQWRADGQLSYLSKRGEATQLWINALDGTEPRPLTDREGGIGAYWWAPSGLRLAVLAAGEKVECEDETADWTVYDRLEQPDTYSQLWVLEAVHGDEEPWQGTQLTQAPCHPNHVAWSPDSKTIALSYHPRFSGLVDEDHHIALVDVNEPRVEPITPVDRHASMAAFSPDGSRLAFFMDRDSHYRAYQNLKDLVIYDLGEKTLVVVPLNTEMALGGVGTTPDTAPVFTPSGQELIFKAAKGTRLDLYRANLESGAFTPLIQPEGNVADFSVAAGHLALIDSDFHRLPTLWMTRLKAPEKPVKCVSLDDALAAEKLDPAEKISLPGADGTRIQGFLFLPPGAERKGKHPTIVEMHGGPYFRYGNAWSSRYPWQVLSQEGFAVLIVNPRGGTAYGLDFLRGVYRNFGTDDYRDIMAAVDFLVEEGISDPDRMGFTGYSYGGLMTNVVISRTTRFKAAVSIAGIFNYVSAMGQNNPQLFIDSYLQPWDGDLETLWKHSPASRVNQVTTPTLIMHGTDDQAVDPRQSIEMFTYLQLNGVSSRLVLYPGEGHGINKPSHMMDYIQREVDWFRHYLLGDEEAEGAKPPVTVWNPTDDPAFIH